MSGRWLRIAPDDELDPVADDVVLERLDGKRVLGFERLEPALRHRERIVREVDLLLVLVPLVHREVDDPAELERVALAESLSSCADADARRASELGGLGLLVAGEEHRIARGEAGARDQRPLRPGAKNLAIGPLPAIRVAVALEK